MTGGDIAQRRVVSQRLAGPGLQLPSDAVRWLVAVQSQDYGSAKWALGARVATATDASVEEAFAAGAILRTHLLRPTWHFVDPADIRFLLALTTPRVQAVNAHMYRKLGIDAALLRRSSGAVEKALRSAHQLTREELRDSMRGAGVPVDGEFRMGYLMMHAELDGLICSGPRRGKQHTYALLDERVPPTPALTREESLADLAVRYFASRGPATVHDLAKWSGLTVTDARHGAESVRARLECEVVEGTAYWFSSTIGAASAQKGPTAHLLSIYDELVSGYQDRSAIVRKENGAKLKALGNALTHIVVMDGRIVGTWKPRPAGAAMVVAVRLFDRPKSGVSRAIAAAAERLGAFMGLAVRVEM